MKIFVTGYGRHGKDTCAEFLRDKLGLSFVSSSWFVAERVVFPAVAEEFGYSNVTECFEDRHNHRDLWFNLICEYNKDNPERLSGEIFDEYDIYVGIRNYNELEAAKKKWDDVLVIWVDAAERMPPEGGASCTVRDYQADLVIKNNGSEEEFTARLDRLCELLAYNRRPGTKGEGEDSTWKMLHPGV